MVWGGISEFLQTDLVVVEGHVDSEVYIETILEGSNTIGEMDKLLGAKQWRLQQDGATAHTSRRTMKFLRKRCKVLKNWPPNSPDLNPIEHLWSILDVLLRASPPNTIEQLKATVVSEWNKLSFELLHNLVASMEGRLQKVIDLAGASLNGHWDSRKKKEN